MPNRFAALQTRINDAQIKHLSDKTLFIDGADVEGLFNSNYVDPFNVETSSPMFECKESDVQYINHGAWVSDGLVVYLVRSIQRDGLGMVKLILELQDG